MFRSLLLKLSDKAKTVGLLDRAVRCDPFTRRAVHDLLLKNPPHMPARMLLDNLRHARQTAYGVRYSASLSDWPLLEKSTLRNAPQDFINRWSLLRFPAGTGGTTGAPLKLWRSLTCIAAEQAFLDHLVMPFGHDMNSSRLAILRADAFKTDNPDMPYGRLSHGGKRLVLSSAHLNHETAVWYHGALERFAPEILWVYPSAALNLLRLLEQNKFTLKIPVILASSEVMPAPLHRALAEFFSAQLVNYYGQAERVCLASSTEPGQFRFNPFYGHVELRDSRDQPSDAGDCLEIVGTNFWNVAMPLVRYRTGDLLVVPRDYSQHDRLEVAAGKRPFTAILGREGEYLLTREGVRVIGLNHIPREVNHIVQIQLVQTSPEALTIRVIPDIGYALADEKAILDNARAKIPPSIIIRIETAQALLTTPRGKAPYVIRAFENK